MKQTQELTYIFHNYEVFVQSILWAIWLEHLFKCRISQLIKAAKPLPRLVPITGDRKAMEQAPVPWEMALAQRTTNITLSTL